MRNLSAGLRHPNPDAADTPGHHEVLDVASDAAAGAERLPVAQEAGSGSTSTHPFTPRSGVKREDGAALWDQ
jgi:hypothetical protein